MPTLVMKFGGAAVATPDKFALIAELILNKTVAYSRIAVVVSAMGKTTDELISLAKQVHPDPPKRELDMLVSVGERISISLLAMALAAKGKEAVSFTGSQSGIITTDYHSDARIIDVRPFRLMGPLEAGKVVIVAGFQGVSKSGEITTLGRGGSDTTAVALGIALNAEKVEFYKDVSGVCAEDPKMNPEAPVFRTMTYGQALEIAEGGAKVLHPRCIALAASNRLPLQVLSFQNGSEGTAIGDRSEKRTGAPQYEEEIFHYAHH